MKARSDPVMCLSGVLEGVWRCVATVFVMVHATVSKVVRMRLDQQKRPPADRGALSEPPKGIEPLTYSLRVNRSGRLS